MRTQRGLRRVVLYRGDCLKVLPRLRAGSCPAIVTDPPWQVGLNEKVCPWDRWPDPAVWRELTRLAGPRGRMAVLLPPEKLHERAPDIVAAGWRVLEVGAWIFGSARPVHRTRLKRAWAAIVFCAQGRVRQLIGPSRGRFRARLGGKDIIHKFFGLGLQYHDGALRMPWRAGRMYAPANVACDAGCLPLRPSGYDRIFAVRRVRQYAANRHPTAKPCDLLAHTIRLISRPGQVILDPFMGCGSTGLAALAIGRRFIGIERNARYFHTAQRRIRASAAWETPPPPPHQARRIASNRPRNARSRALWHSVCQGVERPKTTSRIPQKQHREPRFR